MTVLTALLAPFAPVFLSPGSVTYFPMMSTAPHDIPPYLVRIQQGIAGSLLYRSPFGGWEVWNAGPFPVNVVYNLWGLILAPFKPDPLVAFHLLRVVALLALLPALRLWVRAWVPSPSMRTWQWLIYLGAPIYIFPLPFFRMPDQHTLLSIIDTPHVTLALALWLAALALLPRSSRKSIATVMLIGCITTFLDPFVGVWVPILLATFALQEHSLRWTRVAACGLALIPSAYSAWLSTLPELSGYRLEASPMWGSLATLIPLSLAFVGLRFGSPGVLKRRNLAALFTLHLILNFAAFYVGTRMVIALWPLWTAAMLPALESLRPPWRWTVTAISLFGSIEAVVLMLYVFSGALGSVERPMPSGFPMGYSAHYMEAAAWLSHQPKGVVMGSTYSTNMLPYLSGQIVWLGHTAETPEFKHKVELLKEFWSWDAQRQTAFCHKEHIRWAMLTHYDPKPWSQTTPNLPVDFGNQDVAIYRCDS